MAEDMFAQKGWICPKCGRVLAPSTMYCLWCCSDMKETITTTTTTPTTIPKWDTTPIKGSGMIDSSGTGRSYFVKTSSISRDSHEIADCDHRCKQTEVGCEHTDCLDRYDRKTEPTISKMEQVEDEPQTMLNDGTLVINVEDATKVSRVLVGDDKNRGDLYYPDDEDEPQTERSE